MGEHIRNFADYASPPVPAAGADATSRDDARGPLLNQFPHESVLIAKNLLAESVQARYGRKQPWFAETYTLPHELPLFAAAMLAPRLAPHADTDDDGLPSHTPSPTPSLSAAHADTEEGRDRLEGGLGSLGIPVSGARPEGRGSVPAVAQHAGVASASQLASPCSSPLAGWSSVRRRGRHATRLHQSNPRHASRGGGG